MTSEIYIESIDFDDEKQKGKPQLSVPIKNIVNGREVIPVIYTTLHYHKWSKFASSKFFSPEQRNFIKMEYYKDQLACDHTKKIIGSYDTYLNVNKGRIAGKYASLYTIIESVKIPIEDDDELTQTETKIPKEEYTKIKLNTTWSYYYKDTGVRLDKDNSAIVSKAIRETLKKNKDKKNLDSLVFTLNVKDADDKNIKKIYSYTDIEERKELCSKIYVRKLTSFDDNIKALLSKTELTDADEQTLEELCGEPVEIDVRTGEDLDPHYKGNCYVRFILKPYKVWAARNKDETGKRKMGIQFQCLQMEIIQLPYDNNNNNSVKNLYTKYSFGKNKTDVTNKVESLLIKSDPVVDNKIVSKKEETKKEESKPVKTAVIEDSEDESEEDSEDESEEESEEEVEVKAPVKGKQVTSKSIPIKKK